jgi:hypothetical protein
MKLIGSIVSLFLSIAIGNAQQFDCNCYASGIWPFKKQNTLTIHQEINIIDGVANFKIYAPVLSSDTVNVKLLSDTFLWKFQKESNSFITLEEEAVYSDFNASFQIRLSKRSRLLFYDKISIEFSPLFNYETSQAPMLKKIILHSKKGIKRFVFEKGARKINCFLPISSHPKR